MSSRLASPATAALAILVLLGPGVCPASAQNAAALVARAGAPVAPAPSSGNGSSVALAPVVDAPTRTCGAASTIRFQKGHISRSKIGPEAQHFRKV